jgi:hypothetical protein
MKDPYLPQILGLLAAGMTATGLSISGYLHQPETFRLLGTELTYQAAYRKIPLVPRWLWLVYQCVATHPVAPRLPQAV